MQRYLKTREAAEYLSVDISFLKKNMGSTFIEGVHYHRCISPRLLRWDKNALDLWISTKQRVRSSKENMLIVQKLLG